MRVLVCGSRHFNDYEWLERELNGLKLESGTTIINGGARGADTLAGRFAKAYAYSEECYPADWNTHGRRAGPIRNHRMLREGKPDLVVAFIAPDSRGTKHMVEISRKAGIPVKEINICP